MKKVWVFVLALAMVIPMLAAADPPAPPPEKPSVTSKFAVDFYGYVKVDVGYEKGYGVQDNWLALAGPGNMIGMPFYLSPTKATNASMFRMPYKGEQTNQVQDSFFMTARQTRFGFLIKGPSSDNGLQTQGHIEMDFYGTGVDRLSGKNQDPEENKGLLMLRIATVEIFNDNFSLLAGNDWAVVSPIFPHTNNYPYGADVGNLGYRMPQVRLTLYALDKQLALQIAAVNKMGDVDTLDIDTGRMNGAPTWEWGLMYKNNDNKMMIAYTGHYGMEEIQSKHYGNFGYFGVKVPSFSHNISLQLPLGDYFAINGEYYQGANLDGAYYAGQENGWVLNKNRKREPLHSQGGWGEIMIKPSDKVRLYLGYGIDDVDDYQLYKSTIEWSDGTKAYFNGNGDWAITKNQEYFANLEFYINPATKVCFEYMQLLSDYGNAQNHLYARDLARYGAANWITDKKTHFTPGKVDRYTVSFWYIF